MGKKRIKSPIEGQRMSGVQRPQWEKVMAIEAKIKEAKMIRDRLARTEAASALPDVGTAELLNWAHAIAAELERREYERGSLLR